MCRCVGVWVCWCAGAEVCVGVCRCVGMSVAR